jgi:uridine kinase
VLHENKYLNNQSSAFKSFFIIYEKYIKTSYEQNVEPKKKHANIIIPNFDINEENEIESNPSLEFLLFNLQNLIGNTHRKIKKESFEGNK